LSALIDGCMIADRFHLRRSLAQISGSRPSNRDPRRAPIDAPGALDELRKRIDDSRARVQRRRELIPIPTFPGDLPVVQRKDEIARAIRENQVVVLCGETGSGKTTQLPKICLELGLGVHGAIGHTQPRRIAARSVAQRIAQELSRPLGAPGGVGFKVRFGDRTNPDNAIKLMTDGILLAETRGDRFLNEYEAIIIDEAHERSLNIDFLLGYLRQLMPRRPDLKIIVTSATIDPQRFASHFAGPRGPAPILEISGRTYPVEIRYHPLIAEHEDEEDRDQERGILDAVDELAREGPGDVLVFLSGEREIRETAEALRKHHPAGAEIVPLYARLSAAEQNRVFEPHAARRIVLATNVAETSLTVPGIKYVVDTGVARISRYSAGTKVQRLPIEAISQASANQRSGRCGRVSAGIAIRLYSEIDFAQRPAFTDPEIVRTNLASVILQMASLRLGDVEAFPFIDPPERRLIRDGFETLLELGAVDERNDLTTLGAELAKLPVDPRIGRMILSGARHECLWLVLPIAAGLATQDPRDRPIEKQDQADAAHAEFEHESSDFLSMLNLWNQYRKHSEHLSQSKLRRWCHDRFLSFVRLREWESVHEQLHELVADLGYRAAPPKDSGRAPMSDEKVYEAVHRALLAGLLCNVGKKGEQGFYKGCRGGSFKIFPGSALFGKGPGWLMAAEVVQTTQMYGRTLARIEPSWIEDAAPHLIRKTHGEPVWDREAGLARVPERVTLFGLEISAGRLVPLSPVDPAKARELFIHHALVEGDYAVEAPYRAQNRRTEEEVRKIEAKTRRPDAIADQAARFAFFESRAPKDVVDGVSFERWRRVAERANPRALCWSIDDLLAKERLDIPPDQLSRVFPDRIGIDGAALRVDYRYDPGSPSDGVTITLPIESLNQFESDRADWLVPGMLPRTIEALLESLPKPVRKSVGAISEVARRAAIDLERERTKAPPLPDAVAERVRALTGVELTSRAFQLESLPEHVRLNYRVVDEDGKEIALSRDLSHLRQTLGERARNSFVRLARSPLDADGLTDWSIGDLPEVMQVARRGATITGHPALLDMGTSVSVRVLESATSAQDATRLGLRRLFMIQARDELHYQFRLLAGVERLAAHFAAIGSKDSLREQMLLVIAERAFLGDDAKDAIVRSRAAFDRRLIAGTERIAGVGAEVCAIVEQILSGHHRITLWLGQSHPAAWNGAIADAREQLRLLMPRDFLARTPWARLRHLPRYLAAIEMRLSKLPQTATGRDAQSILQMAPLWRAYRDTAERAIAAGVRSASLEEFRWLLEELRVSLFAQELRTPVTVSVARLERIWSEIRL
jgi:ATP-dependent helicase HrpA